MKKLYIIDGNSYIYRAFYAIHHMSTSGGLPTNAIYGFTSMLLKVIKEHQPDYLGIAFDTKEATFREEMYREYKAHRPDMPDTLVPQIPYIKKVVAALNILSIEKPGYEADDIIGTVAKKIASPDIKTVIITSDKDLMQLVSKQITILDTMKNRVIDPAAVMARFGVKPDQLTDIFGLMGDASDNIPGVLGVGEKTARALIKQFGSIENLYQNLAEVKKEKLKKILQENKKQAELSKKLATIDINMPLDCKLKDFEFQPPDTKKSAGIFKELEFHKFSRELMPVKKISYDNYQLITTRPGLRKLVDRLKKSKAFAVDLETTGLDPMSDKIVGLSFSIQDHESFYIPVAHDYDGVPAQLDRQWVLNELKGVLEDERITKVGQNIKFDLVLLARAGVDLAGFLEDIMLVSYILNPVKRNHNLEDISRAYLGHQMISYQEVVGTGRKKISFAQVELEPAKVYSAEDADVTFLCHKILRARLTKEKLVDLFEEIESPLIRVLADMEMAGVKVDKSFLKKLSVEFSRRLKILEKKIYELGGSEFNIDSPKQLQVVLFEKLKLPARKRTKTGYSTNSDVLTDLAREHELPALILEYRGLAKLKNTYSDNFFELINPETGRVHTSYNQAVTATGRLSSREPNLQNIPIRTEDGKKIRRAFVPAPGCIFVSADYSQIELRILAHFSRDKVLVDAFKNGRDIHTHTAREIFNVSADEVTAEMRRVAKVINFGIIYGMSAHGLVKELKISYQEAQAYIDNYFSQYPDVRSYIEGVIEKARKEGVVFTLFKRPRPLPDINSPNMTIRNFAERTAINSPLQGTAADIMKVAMINIHQALRKSDLKARMILQVHDELVFEVPEKEEGEIVKLVRKEMEDCVQLKVPLKVDVARGTNWSEMRPVD